MNAELLNQSIDTISPQRPIVTVPHDRSLADAFTILTRNNIYSAPIYNDQSKEVTGFIDMMDVVMYIMKIVEEQQTNATDDETPLERKDIYELMEQVRQFEYAKLSSASDISKRNPICTISHEAPLREALKIFENLHTRKLLVLQNPWTIRNVLSQSDVVLWLGKLLSAENPQGMHQPIGPIAHKKLKDVFNMNAKVLAIRGEVQALEAFKLMAHHNVSAVAVLNDDGSLLSTLTAKDIKIIDKDALFTKLYKPSREFVGLARSAVKTQYPYYFCHPDDTVEQLIQKLSFLRVHRIFVIDEERKPISVVSLSDILHALSL